MIKAKDPQLQRITIAENGFLFPEGSSTAETEEGAEDEEQVIELGQSMDEFGVFDQFDPSEDPSGDLGDPSLIKVDFQGTSSQAEMGFKRKPSTNLLDQIKGQLGKDAPGKSQPKLPPPPSKPQLAQTRSSSALSQPSKLPPPIQPANPKRKRSYKGKEPMDEGRSCSPQEEDEA